MNLPNRLTVLRVILIPVFLLVLYWSVPYANYIAAAIFILASITDFFDGYLARKHNLVTDLGKFLDPLADKLLVMSALLYLTDVGRVHAVVTIVILAREFAVTGLRTIAMGKGQVMAAAWSGKVKTTVQMLCIILLLLDLSFLHGPGVVALNAALCIVTLWSGLDYFIRNRNLFETK